MCESCPSSDRRKFLQHAALGVAALAFPQWVFGAEHAKDHEAPKPKDEKSKTGKDETKPAPPKPSVLSNQKVTPDEALARLMEGNKRFVSTKMFHPNESLEARTRLATGQAPFAAILGCADSRVPPEIVFDHGLGDIFVVRVAGNIVEDAGSGSFEYAVEHLGVPLIVVLGHERCGAVKAAVESVESGEAPPGHIAELVRKLKPAIDKTKDVPGDKLENAMRENVKRMTAELAGLEPILKEKVDEGKLKVVAMRYDLDTGMVEVL